MKTGCAWADVVQKRRADEGLPEKERWQQLAMLEKRCDAVLAEAGLLQERVASIRLVQGASRIPAGVSRVVLLATPDPLPLAVELLEKFAERLPVDVVMFGPVGEPDLFDEWGRVREEIWAHRPLPLDFSSQVRLCADATDQAARITRLLLARTYGAPEGLLAIGVADPEVAPVLENRLRGADLKVFNPGGHPRRRDGLYALLAALADLVREPAFASPSKRSCAARISWRGSPVKRNFMPAAMLSELDALYARHLPATLAGALWRTRRSGRRRGE